MVSAGRQARLEAEARNERRLEGIGCTRLLRLSKSLKTGTEETYGHLHPRNE
jgi:hypothetical protein